MNTIRSKARPFFRALASSPASRRGLAIALVATGVVSLAGAAPVGARSQAATSAAVDPGAITVWPSSTVPSSVDGQDTSAVEVGMKFKVDVNGTITALRFYKASTNTGTHTAKVWSAGGTLLGSATFTNETSSGWQQATFASPVSVTAGAVYVASYYAPKGHYSATNNFFASQGADNGSLHALASGVSGANGVYRYGTSGFPTSSYQSSNYWVDVAFNAATTPTTVAPTTTTVAPTTTTVAPTTTTVAPTTTIVKPTTTTIAPTTTTTVAPPPAAWPGPSNTGIPAGTVLTPVNGSITISTAGAVLSDKDITGCVNVNANNVTISRIKVHGCAQEPMVNVGYGRSGILIQDSELDGQNLNGVGSAVGYEGYTIRRSNVHNVGKGLHMTANVTIEDNWIHDLYEMADSHNDDIVTNGGSNFVVRHNTLQNTHTQTATVALYGDFAPVVNALIENNLLVGGGYTVYGGSVAGKPYSAGANNIRFVNNVFSKQYWPKGGYWGPASAFDASAPGNAWSGNVWADTGQPVASS
jgi:hypothetical protein